jgi:glycosyltransferase involved in cell wall biosynthesis
MPVYNAQPYLSQAVESILGQTLGDFEFLIIDDGSTDRSRRILKRYAARDARIRLSSRANKGLVATLNELVGMARGEFLARMDADDIALPERFEKQAQYLRAHPDCALVGCRAWEIDADGDTVGECPTLGDHDAIDAFHFRMEGPALLHPSVMMRREAVLAVGGYRPFAVSEEVDLYLRLAERWRLGRVPEILLEYRVHGSNYSRDRKRQEKAYRVNCEILIDAFRRRNLPVSLPPPVDYSPGPEHQRSLEWHHVMGWQHLMNGRVRRARKYAAQALTRRPLSLESWRLFYCAIRGY